MSATGPTYWDYLGLDKLLALQGGLDGDDQALMPDELHFIVVHQAFELWFKLSVRELREARDHLASPKVPEEKVPHVVHHLRRVSEILRLAVDQFRVMETLTPQDFLAFRDKLIPASGFQSFQLRELEILLGLEDGDRLKYGGEDPLDHIKKLAADSPAGELAWKHISQARQEQSLKSALGEWLYRTPVHGSSPGDTGDDDVVLEFVGGYHAALKASNEGKAERMAEALGKTPEPLRKRLAEAELAAEQFLFAYDVPEADRARQRRIRAAVSVAPFLDTPGISAAAWATPRARPSFQSASPRPRSWGLRSARAIARPPRISPAAVVLGPPNFDSMILSNP